ncbi:MAG: PAS domain-containing protein, partial [Candidatus Bathyarchaeota archaeon]
MSEIIREPEVTANFIPVGIVVISKENGKIVFVNNHAKELCGADPTNLEINNNLPKLIKLLTLGGDIYPFEKLPARKALSTGISITDELMIEHQDGSRIIVKVSANPIKNEKGEIIAAVAIFEDITTEKEVNRKVASLSKFPSENPNAVIRLTRHGVILYSNDAGYLLLRKWKTNVGEKAPKKLVSKINKTFLTKKVKAFEVDVGNKTFLLQMVPVI